ncbi:Xanthine dehydrogenase, iron-sulfur cluster and FAD-binding subunit A [Rhodovulum sp. PH10]|uniref:xanthine dehydrogenase small subunit n=1 Tax=Rhodovulum sp. PH10 TaxID=1187851 RepID=UPI00027C2879|nr:xanthine dehydrogenase small subunit [Rhodovulum sp. PH10]EJW13482.1 Xanthine dehydrogenase, iron-sulfur cluster and FAD-binding subunit A [Rhodovulum sp. PH10]
MTRDFIRFVRRGRVVELRDFSARTTLLDWLRLDERSTGTKEACAEGDCGACTVVLARRRDDTMAYEPVNACITLLGQIDGAELITVEDLAAPDGTLHPVQAALVERHGSQCGFCTPGIVMSLFAHYHRVSAPPTRAEIDDVLAGNLCRCTGYRPIVDAAIAACNDRNDRFTADEPARLARLEAIADDEDILVGDDGAFFAAPAREDTLAALLDAHPDATIVAGATDVGLWITKKLMPLSKIVHVGRVVGLDMIEESETTLTFGAAVPLARAAEDLGALDPDIAEILRRFGSVQVRTAGTVGGSIANASPIGDLAPILLALGGTIAMRKGMAVRTLPIEEFFIDYGKQDRAAGEYVRHLTIQKPGETTLVRAFKITKRMDEDISTVMMAMAITLDGDVITSARIAFGGMAGIPKRATQVEAALAGARLADPATWRTAASRLGDDFTPLTDQRGSAAYRLTVAGNLIVKGLAEMAGTPTTRTRVKPRAEVFHAAP